MSELDWKCGFFFVTFIKIWLYQIKNESAGCWRGVGGAGQGHVSEQPGTGHTHTRRAQRSTLNAQCQCSDTVSANYGTQARVTQRSPRTVFAVSPPGALYVLVCSPFIPFSLTDTVQSLRRTASLYSSKHRGRVCCFCQKMRPGEIQFIDGCVVFVVFEVWIIVGIYYLYYD